MAAASESGERGHAQNNEGDSFTLCRSEKIFREVLSRRESGEEVDVEKYIHEYPELEEVLLKLFDRLKRSEIEYQGPQQSGSGEVPDTIGDFKIISEIGKGGQATVYAAEQISLHRRVALKLLPSHLSFSDEAVKKFRREAEAGGRQSHPGIVAVHAVGEHKGIHYIAQELVEGSYTLADRLEAFCLEGVQPQGYFRDVAQFGVQLCDALKHAHESGVIHRDIKPSNILLTKDGTPKINDFGLAKIEDALALSRTGDFAGTPYYMSPEQAASKRIGIDHRTDIFSLGVTLYEMLTLNRPFEGDTSQEVLKKILLIDPVEPHKANPCVPSDLSTICLKAMAKMPERRYQSVGELSDDLGRFLHGDVILAKPAGPGIRLWKRVRRNPTVSAAVGVAMLAIVAFLGYVLLWSYPQIKLERDKAINAKQDAEREKNRAITAEKLAEERAQVIQKNSDLSLVYRLKAEAEELWPAYPKEIEDIKRWLYEARGLLTREKQYRLELNRLQSIGQFDAKTGQFDAKEAELKNVLEKLIWEINSLGIEESGLIMDVEKRLFFAETVREESIEKYRKEWDEAIASITDELECPQYGGLVIEEMIGFVPIGQDPDSGLWEFAHLQTGEIPVRDIKGKLFLQEKASLVFVLIPGGAFQMGAIRPSEKHPLGSPNVDPQASADEGPVHPVNLKAFFLSKYEMTQGQWLGFMKSNPSIYHIHSKVGGHQITLFHPVENVRWAECIKTLRRLKLRLPSESEWEYAARAGTSTIWWTGNDKESLDGAANLCDEFWKKSGASASQFFEDWLNDGFAAHAPVGSFRPNPFGLHDICGNVAEWCQDSAGRYDSTPTNGSPYELGDLARRILRGGCWFEDTQSCRSANRDGIVPSYSNAYVGLRPALSLH